jgi:hypothetical protein
LGQAAQYLDISVSDWQQRGAGFPLGLLGSGCALSNGLLADFKLYGLGVSTRVVPS